MSFESDRYETPLVSAFYTALAAVVENMFNEGVTSTS